LTVDRKTGRPVVIVEGGFLVSRVVIDENTNARIYGATTAQWPRPNAYSVQCPRDGQASLKQRLLEFVMLLSLKVWTYYSQTSWDGFEIGAAMVLFSDSSMHFGDQRRLSSTESSQNAMITRRSPTLPK